MKKTCAVTLFATGFLMISGEPGEGTPFWLLMFCGLMLIIGALIIGESRERRFLR